MHNAYQNQKYVNTSGNREEEGVKMILHCAICDDSPQALKLTTEKAEKVFLKKNISYKLFTYTDSKQFLFDIDHNSQLDLAILDIDMPSPNGLELAKTIKKLHKNCLIIFLTSYLNYAVDGYELEIFRFVPKTDIEERLERTIGDATKIIDFDSKRSYIIQKHDLICRIEHKNILYIIKNGKNSIIHCLNNEDIKVRKTLSEIYDELAAEEFIYIDRGCIANMANVQRLDERDWICKNGDRLAVSRTIFNETKKKLIEFWGRKILDD